ncbi:MAG: MarR family transcriptional regulator [Acidobacteriales bacterium]|nr:MarR family transcriptional regulator [Terriglobales bacterium]
MKPIFIAVQQLERHIGSELEAALSATGLSAIEAHVLQSLYEKDGLRVSVLARSVGRATTSFTPLLDGLESKGLIERRAHPRDRRAVNIHLTTRGTQLRAEVRQAISQVETQMAGELYDHLPIR